MKGIQIRHGLRILFVLAGGLAAGLFLDAQPVRAGDPPPCAFDDGLESTGACCALTGPSIPIAFPAFEQEIRYFTWNNCNLARNKTLCVEVSPLEFARDGEGDLIGCGTYTLPVSMITCGPQGQPLFSGELMATYARTWIEKQPSQDPDTQVWRFMINGDLTPSSFLLSRYGANPHLPQCHVTFDAIHWFGHIDYRRDCSTLEWDVEWVLEHSCDEYHHGSSSARSGSFHPSRTFNIAGPSTFAPSTSFTIPALTPHPNSPGIRTTRYNGDDFAMCFRYEPFSSLQVFLGDDDCPCGTGGDQFLETVLFGDTLCGNGIPGASGPIPTRKKLGSFGSGRRVITWAGLIGFTDACTGPSSTGEFMEGVEVLNDTTENFLLTEAGSLLPLGPTFIDLASSNSSTGTFLQGVPHFSRLHIQFND